MSILIFFIILIALILVHEFGHFIVAKKSGVRVDEFGIGFPPKLWGKKFGETEYTVNALPFGGFVRIWGEDPSEESMSSERSMVSKQWYIKAAIIAAGVVMNVVFAWFLFVVGFTVGMPQAIDASEYVDGAKMLVSHVLKDSPAEVAGLRPGDTIVSVSDGTVAIDATDPKVVSEFIAAHNAQPVAISIVRGEESLIVEATPQTGLVESDAERAAIGFGLGLIVDKPLPLPQAIIEASFYTVELFVAIFISILQFIASAFTFSADLSQVTGPVGIVGLVQDASEIGFMALLTFTAVISLNLAVINLLPFPALDGGRLIITLIEAARGKMFPTQVVNVANGLGFVLLILLMIVVTWNDIMRIVG
jgi:regulator of sigma E protease